MMLVTPEQLVKLYQIPYIRAANFTSSLNSAMWNAAIVTPERIRAFLAQIGHESGRLQYVREIWGPTSQQLKYERDSGAAWPPTKQDQRNKVAYSLGNVEQGDGHARHAARAGAQIDSHAPGITLVLEVRVQGETLRRRFQALVGRVGILAVFIDVGLADDAATRVQEVLVLRAGQFERAAQRADLQPRAV